MSYGLRHPLGPEVVSKAATDLEQDGRLDYRYLAAVDIERFSELAAADQSWIQDDLAHVLKIAADAARLDRSRWEVQVGGDGELAILPADTDGLRLVADYPRELAGAIADVNRARRDRPRFRIRLALHHGTLAPGQFGPVGQAPIVVSRLLDAEPLRQRLRGEEHLDLVVMVSARLFFDVIMSRFRGLDPRDFRRIEFDAKGAAYAGYIFQGSWSRLL